MSGSGCCGRGRRSSRGRRAGKLGVIREMMRCDGPPSPGSDHGDLPETWSASLRYELAAALACSTQSAEATASLAWELRARLPGIGARLEDGTLTQAKARAVTETFGQLMDADAAAAEAMIVDQLGGQDLPAGAAPGRAGRPHRRPRPGRAPPRARAEAERAGVASSASRPAPPPCPAATCPPTRRWPRWPPSTPAPRNTRSPDAFGDTPMDVLRAYAYLDLINGLPAAGRIAAAAPQDDAAESLAWAQAQARAAARAAADAKTGTGTGPDPDPAADPDGGGGERIEPTPARPTPAQASRTQAGRARFPRIPRMPGQKQRRPGRPG